MILGTSIPSEVAVLESIVLGFLRNSEKTIVRALPTLLESTIPMKRPRYAARSTLAIAVRPLALPTVLQMSKRKSKPYKTGLTGLVTIGPTCMARRIVYTILTTMIGWMDL